MPSFADSQREESIGVSVKETSSDTAMAKAIVTPNEFMNRPTMPPMKATGRKTAISDRLVASTARPTSLVPSTAASRGLIFFSSMKRKMFSSTTTASSITMPTASVSASSVMTFEREAHVLHGAEGGDQRGGNGDGRDERRPEPAQEEQHDAGREERAEQQVLLHRARPPRR